MTDDTIFESIEGFFIEDEWEFHRMEESPVLSMGFSGKNGKWNCYAQAREAQRQFVFYSVMPINAPEDKRNDVAEFVTRSNYGMIIGNFELDYRDGEVRYKTSIDVEGTILEPALIRQLVYANVIITDRYLPGLMSVIYGGKDPMTAVEQIEAPPQDIEALDEGEEMPDLSGLDLSFLDDDDDDDDFDDDDKFAGDKLN
ncbi:MAG: YbjN domain-containing protein [Aggregatilineales bacterium]